MMQTLDVNQFLLSLCCEMSRLSGLVFATTNPSIRRQLWMHELIEDQAAQPATSLRPYGGTFPAGMICRPSVSIQGLTLGKDAGLVWDQAMKVHQAWLDDAGRPRSHWTIAGQRLNADRTTIEADPERDWEIVLAMPLGRPGMLGRDEAGRWMCSGNVDVEFVERVKV